MPLSKNPRIAPSREARTKGNAIKVYQKRKTEALEGKKLPEKLRRAIVTSPRLRAMPSLIRRPIRRPLAIDAILGGWKSCSVGSARTLRKRSWLRTLSGNSNRSKGLPQHPIVIVLCSHLQARHSQRQGERVSCPAWIPLQRCQLTPLPTPQSLRSQQLKWRYCTKSFDSLSL